MAITLPGQIGAAEARQAFLQRVIAEQFAVVSTATPTPDPNAVFRRPMPGDLGRPLNARLP